MNKKPFFALALFLCVAPARAADRQYVNYNAPAAVANTAPLRRHPLWNRLNLGIALPLRDREGLTNLLEQLYDPASPNFHQFLTPDQFAERFGPTREDYDSVVAFAQSHGLTVTATHSNRTLVSVRGTVAGVERAFHVKMNEYRHPTEPRTFYAPDAAPSLDLTTPVLGVSGLDDYVLPHPCFKRIPTGQAQPQTGSGPGGTYLGNDFRAAYVPGVTLTGTGQTVGLLEFDSGFLQSDITAYETLAGLPNVPVSAVLLDGYGGGPGGSANVEVSLDIEMAISMAPGLTGVLVYEGSTTDDILNRMATDDVAKQMSASWTYPIDAESDQIFLQYAAQGQSFYNASGDSGAYSGTVSTPADDPNITVVGGTTLTTSGAGGPWLSETTWTPYSSGGISTVRPIPIWQQGINMTANQGSTTMRNLPDVALTADNVFVIAQEGEVDVGGTSCATPLWAAFTALMNQLALTNGEPTVGFINPAVYAIGKGSNSLPYTSLFHDITTGNNENSSSPNKFSAVSGYDLCTGWGTPTGGNLISALALPEPLRITPTTGEIFTGPVGGPFAPVSQFYSLSNSAGVSLTWSLSNSSPLFVTSPTSGALARSASTNVTTSLAATDTNLAAGSYSTMLQFIDLSDNFSQFRQVTLAVVTPPVITAQPSNQAVLDGMTATFSVGTGSNALMFYHWRDNGTNLSDGGNISGSATSTLIVGNVSSTNLGSYSVILSNAAGVLISSNAVLTIIPSQPVIVQQPTNETVLPGAPATFSVAVVGNTPYSYQWLANGTNLVNNSIFSGVTGNILTISNVSPGNAATYSVIVTNSLGSATSAGAVLSVTPVTAPGLALTTLCSFGGAISGEISYSPLTLGNNGVFYGTTLEGGADDDGTIFSITTNGALTTLTSFNDNNGAIAYGGLVQTKNGDFYGATYEGGTDGEGRLYVYTQFGAPAGLNLDGLNGEFPVGGMTLGSDGNLYGTTLEGGDYGDGTIYRMTPALALTTLVSLNGTDGLEPTGVLVQGTDGNYYGTTEVGGANGDGSIFKMTPSGGFSVFYSFRYSLDGAVPVAGLVQASDGNFYGTAYEGGSNGLGTVFEITPDGTFTTRYTFTGGNDGGTPWGGLMQAPDGNLYGTTESGGEYGDGTVFRMAPTGQLSTVMQFDGYAGGAPAAALVEGPDGNLYGTTSAGGVNSDGVVYRLNFSGPLQITGQPADQTVYTGGTASFSVATFGGGPVFYQWQQDGVNLINGGNISGANSTTLTLSNVTAIDAALYTVVVSNAQNSLTSDYAILGVTYSPPEITAQPASQTVVAGMPATFAVTALGDETLSYQWQENGTNLADGNGIGGSATSTLTIASATLTNNGTYSVIVSNSVLAVPSQNAVLTVVPVTLPGASINTLRFFSGSDAAFPYAGLMEGNDGSLYGTTEGGGSDFDGVIFKLGLNGAFRVLYNFAGEPQGANPYAGLVQGTDSNFYGTSFDGGAGGDGIVFRMTPANSYTVSTLYSFEDSIDGANPYAALAQAANGIYYGTSFTGGSNSYGSVFKFLTNGAVSSIYGFTGGNDGGEPYAGVVQGRDGRLYGTTTEFGVDDFGTVFSLTTNGLLTTLAAFNNLNGNDPQGGLIQGADGSLYGTTAKGGSDGYGTVFSLTTNGTLTTLFSFGLTNGSAPEASLTQATDGNLYGTTSAGGAGGQGTVFRITTNGSLTTLLSFDGYNGADPEGPLLQASDGNFYGTTAQGGSGFNPSAGGGFGTLFQLTVPIFISNSIAGAPAIACLPYPSSTISNFANALPGDLLTFEKVSGPAWLNVSSNGTLSGAPTNANIGTNTFVVSLTDSNGFYATANLVISVIPDPPPSFIVNPFSESWAYVDEEYSASIATNATTPELGAGDALTFGLVSGPAWLNVAPNGTLFGMPGDLNAGTNTFVVSVTNLGGASATATLSIFVDGGPVFLADNFSTPPATVGVLYGGTIATNAVDPDIAVGGTLTFYKVTGPAWLYISANGVLSGTPLETDVGNGTYLVLAVDSGGLAAVGTLSIAVGPLAARISHQGAYVTLSWSGGPGLYQILTATNLAAPVWQPAGGLILGTNTVLSSTNGSVFFRIVKQ